MSVLDDFEYEVMNVFVPGIPKPQGSKRAFVNPKTNRAVIVEDNTKTRDWRADVKMFSRDAYTGAPVEDKGMWVSVTFVMPRPKSTPKTKPTPRAVKKPDVDKLLRGILDALTGTVWKDDSQVVHLVGRKRIAEIDEQPGARISVRTLDDPA